MGSVWIHSPLYQIGLIPTPIPQLIPNWGGALVSGRHDSRQRGMSGGGGGGDSGSRKAPGSRHAQFDWRKTGIVRNNNRKGGRGHIVGELESKVSIQN